MTSRYDLRDPRKIANGLVKAVEAVIDNNNRIRSTSEAILNRIAYMAEVDSGMGMYDEPTLSVYKGNLWLISESLQFTPFDDDELEGIVKKINDFNKKHKYVDIYYDYLDKVERTYDPEDDDYGVEYDVITAAVHYDLENLLVLGLKSLI